MFDLQVENTEDFASDALVMEGLMEGDEDREPISRESVRAELDQLGMDQQTGNHRTRLAGHASTHLETAAIIRVIIILWRQQPLGKQLQCKS